MEADRRMKLRRIEKLEEQLRPPNMWTRRTPEPELTPEEQEQRMTQIMEALEEAVGLDGIPAVLIANGVAPDAAMGLVDEIRAERAMRGAGDDGAQHPGETG